MQINYITCIYKINPFLNILKKKSPSAKAKELKCLGSPYWKALELLREILQLKMLD